MTSFNDLILSPDANMKSDKSKTFSLLVKVKLFAKLDAFYSRSDQLRRQVNGYIS